MKLSLLTATTTALFLASAAFAQAPSAAPSGSTGECKDGSFTSAPSKRGACAGHKGVKDWYASADAVPVAPPAAKAGAPATTPAPAPTPTAASMPKATATTPARTPAAGGGAGQVWVNTASKVYHCPGTKYYGTTKAGEYMTEAAAKAAGAHGDHGKACTTG